MITRWCTALLVILWLFSQTAVAGGFIGVAVEGRPLDRIVFPTGYEGAGGMVNNSVCLDLSQAPTGADTAQIEGTVLKAIDTWNEMRPAIENLGRSGSRSDVPPSTYDLESLLLHELGHCIGLSHVNLATESGETGSAKNGTKAQPGDNGVYDNDAGPDGRFGSSDDMRGDDRNVSWFNPANNDPLSWPATLDINGFTLDTAQLPSGQSWVANGDRNVLADLGYDDTESAMQQGSFFDESQRRLTAEDVGTAMLGRAGLDGLSDTDDDYELTLEYAGQTASDCDINIEFSTETSFARCQWTSTPINGNAARRRLIRANVQFSPTIRWYFSATSNTQVLPMPLSGPELVAGELTQVSVEVSKLVDTIAGLPNGEFEYVVADQRCSGAVVEGVGTCFLTAPLLSGEYNQTIRYFGSRGFDASKSERIRSVLVEGTLFSDGFESLF